MTLFRAVHDKNNPYVIINKNILSDNRLSWKAKGIWLYAFSRPDDWQFYEADIINQSIDGKESVRNGLKELQSCGYLHKTQARNEKNQFSNAEWYFFETSKSEEEIKKMFPKTENPSTGTQTAENQPLLSKEGTKYRNNYYPPQGGGDPSDRVGGSFSSLDKLDIDDDLKTKISKEHTEEAVNLAVDRTLKWKGRPNDRAGVMTALKKADEWHDVLEAEEVTEKNRKWLENNAHLDGQTISGYQCMVGPDYICFYAGTVSKQFNDHNPNMIAEAREWINKKKQK